MRKTIFGAAAALTVAACGSGGDRQQDSAAQPASPASTQTAAVRPASFGTCSACHSVDPDRNGIGPTLHGLVGRAAGGVPGYAYSDAMKKSGLTWDAPTLDRFLANPREVMPGTKMAYSGLKDEQKRAELIAYLATLK